MTDKQKNPFATLLELQRALQKALGPVEEFSKQREVLSRLQLQGKRLKQEFTQFEENLRKVGEELSQYRFALPKEFIEQIARVGRIEQALSETGWLPHYTTPFELLDEWATDKATVGDNLEEYYRYNWGEVRRVIEKRILVYSVDEEARATFREALQAHEQGLYRSVCRTLFPEIERLTRADLYEGQFNGIASQQKLRELAGELMPFDIEPKGYFGMMLFRKLEMHLYVKVKPENLEEIAKDAVPNRHAAIHGHVPYNSFQNSLNTIFITDYIFQTISFLKNAE